MSETMDVLCKRIAQHELNDGLAPVLLEVDAAAEVLERADEEELQHEQQTHVRRQSERTQFVAAYSQRRQAVRAQAAAAKGRGRANGGRSVASGQRGPSRGLPRFPTEVDQATARQSAPDGSSIWRGLTRQEWCGHLPPNSRIHSKWSEWGEQNAMKDVLRRLWRQWAELHGQEYPACCPCHDLLAHVHPHQGEGV